MRFHQRIIFFFGLFTIFPCLVSANAQEVPPGRFGTDNAKRSNVPKRNDKAKKPVPEFPFKRFYVDASLGYGFSLGTIHLTGAYKHELFPSGSNLRDHGFSFGSGLNVGVSFGYKFNKYLSLELGGSYMAYPTRETWSALPVNILEQDTSGHYSKSSYTLNSMRISSQSGHIAVQLVVSPGFRRVDPYVKAGLAVSIANIRASQSYSVGEGGAWQEGSREIFQQSFSGSQWAFRAGFLGAIGMNVHISPLISLFAEWQFSISNFVQLDWGDLHLKSEQGDKEAAKKLLDAEPQRFTGVDHLSFNSHGLRIGVKFKF